MSKKCLNCGAELPENASFCPHCTTAQAEKQPVKQPRRWKRKAALALTAVVLLAAILLGISVYHRPETYTGGAEIVYTDKAGTYHVLLTFSSEDGVVKQPQAEAYSTITEDVESAFPSQLYIYKEGTEEAVWNEFLDKVESCQVDTVALEGSQKMNASQPASNADFPYAAMTSDITYNSSCTNNEIIWTLKMKNGDTLCLKQQIQVEELAAVSYYPEEVPMDTLEDLQKLLDQIHTEIDSDIVVNLYLPPITYEGALVLKDHVFNLYGGSDGENQTTFTDTLSVHTPNYQFSKIFGICFSGNGGTGIRTDSSLILHNCLVSGWDIGGYAQEGAWLGATDSVFENNGIALDFNTTQFSGSAPNYANNHFLQNGTAILIENLPGDEVLWFGGCVFSGNEMDIDSPSGHPIDISEAIFE